MEIEFYKYHGAGNDFIIIDNRNRVFPIENRTELIKRLCQRKFGVGSDGLILLDNDLDYDFYMDFFNPDGSQSFCGNGSRCVVMFASHLGIINSKCTFRSVDGINKAEVCDSVNVKLQMFDVADIEIGDGYHYLNTGSPHYNLFVNDVSKEDLRPIAHGIRYNERFKEIGTNVNIISENEKGISIRTYERGVEDETWACGTGAVACAISYGIKRKMQGHQEVNVTVKGGALKITYDSNDLKTFDSVHLIGPAKFVFKGRLDV